jgi:YfiH family protein
VVGVVELGGECLAGVTDRTAGNLASHVGDDPASVAGNRERLRRALRVERLVFVRQVHGAQVCPVSAAELSRGATELDVEADVLVTTDAGVGLAVVVADCLPILLADPQAGIIAAAHSGRPGLVAGVLPAAVAAMARLGARPDRTVALVGPGVCGGCYEVPAAMRDELAAVLPGAAGSTRWGTPSLDLPVAALRQLASLGVSVQRDARCTVEDARLFSHRRDGRERPTGRFAGWVLRR